MSELCVVCVLDSSVFRKFGTSENPFVEQEDEEEEEVIEFGAVRRLLYLCNSHWLTHTYSTHTYMVRWVRCV